MIQARQCLEVVLPDGATLLNQFHSRLALGVNVCCSQNPSSVPEGPNVYRNSMANTMGAPEERNILIIEKLLLRSSAAKNIMV